ncbi:FtsX-like permease family protein [Maribellus comscasis]|uniref:FtsX-like permease family protein n=1 Tax=Maribellus comscasis TaxID=2681766 RepID=A0A6I6JZN7_9BACT|nr:ABC transporter permease [Maribellus comscasis]QGY44653.1 FtsX-like permease family protein [Maribellus comscasis]
MLQHYLKLIFRNFAKHRRFFVVNIIGLSIGIATFSMLWMHIQYEKSYDQFYPQTENLYRISYHASKDGKQLTNSCRTQSALGLALQGNPELIAASCRAFYESCFMYTDNVQMYNQDVVWADSAFFNVFQNEMVLGDISTAVSNKYTTAISDKMARIYFGDEDPVGKIIKLNEGIPFTVTAVFKSLPENTHLHYDFVVSFYTLEDYGVNRQGNWRGIFVSTYFRKTPAATETDITNLLTETAGKYLTNNGKDGLQAGYSIMPVKDIYLQSDLEGEFVPQGNRTKVKLLLVVAIFIIVIAWTNNINISTALSFERVKASAIRKINGANNRSLTKYHLAELLVINLTSILFSLVLILLALPLFRSFVDNNISIASFLQPWFWFMFGGILLSGMIFTGTISALLQSSFNPLQVVNNKITNSGGFGSVRYGLTVFQFMLAIILIGSTTLIFKQINFLKKSNLGMNPSQVLVMRGPATNNTTGERRYHEFCAFREELLQSPYVEKITATMNIPGQTNRYNNVTVSRRGKQLNTTFNISFSDENYFATYQVPILAGRNFYPILASESKNVIINTKAAEAMGFEAAEQAIGEKINIGDNEMEIVGVAQNFHHESLQKELEPYIYQFRHPHEFGYYPALVKTSNIPALMKSVKQVWEKHYPQAQADFFFLDGYFNKQYFSYNQLGQLAGASSLLAIIIACLGLYALVSHTVNKKVKEIGVRKVNGARISEILVMLNKDFVKWVIIAFVFGTPLAWYAMNKWLENFAYKTNLSWWIFALAGVLALGIALLTVSWQSWRAATRNPVEALRYE